YLVDNHFVDSSFHRQFISSTVHFVDSSFRQQSLRQQSFRRQSLRRQSFRRQSFRRQFISSTVHFVDRIIGLAESKRQEIIKSKNYLIDEKNHKNHPESFYTSRPLSKLIQQTNLLNLSSNEQDDIL